MVQCICNHLSGVLLGIIQEQKARDFEQWAAAFDQLVYNIGFAVVKIDEEKDEE